MVTSHLANVLPIGDILEKVDMVIYNYEEDLKVQIEEELERIENNLIENN